MHSIRNTRKTQSGFTLIELIVVIVIIGILAAVAIPKLTDTQTAAREGVQDAVHAALKSAWSIAYAKNKGTPVSLDNVAKAMSDPLCAEGPAGTITCTGITINTGDPLTLAKYTLAGASTTALVVQPSDIVLLPANR